MQLVQKIIVLAENAGARVMRVYSSKDFGTSFKKDHSPLTRADQFSHQLITETLREMTPDIPVLSEESKGISYERRCRWNQYWLVDPLDGTKEFIQKNGEFCVNIALIENRRPVLGVVHAPVLRSTYYAAAGQGAFKIAEGACSPIRVRDYRTGDLTVVASRSHGADALRHFLNRVRPARVLHIGSSLKICLVAEGQAHLYPRFGPTMEWDTAAAHAIVNEAGGHLTDLTGHTLIYNKEDLLNPAFMVCGDPPFPWGEHTAAIRENSIKNKTS